METIPWPQVEGAQQLPQLQGWLWGRGALSPTQPWLPRLAASASPCGNAISNHHGAFGPALTPEMLSPTEKLCLLITLPLPRTGDRSHLACLSSMAISKLPARSCPGTRGHVCHWCHCCAPAGECRAEPPQQHPKHSRGSAHGAALGATWGNCRSLRDMSGWQQSAEANHRTTTPHQQALPPLFCPASPGEQCSTGRAGARWVAPRAHHSHSHPAHT